VKLVLLQIKNPKIKSSTGAMFQYAIVLLSWECFLSLWMYIMYIKNATVSFKSL